MQKFSPKCADPFRRSLAIKRILGNTLAYNGNAPGSLFLYNRIIDEIHNYVMCPVFALMYFIANKNVRIES